MTIIGKIIVRVHTGQFSHCCVCLYFHEVFIIIHIKGCFVGVFYTPHQNSTDHHRVSQLVIHFQALTVEVAGPQGNFLFGVKRIHPIKTILFNTAYILSKEQQHSRPIWLYHNKAKGDKQSNKNT